MKIKKRFCFRKEGREELYQYLTDTGVEVKEDTLCVAEVFTEDPCWEKVSYYLQKYNILCTNETLFTKEELNDAQWMKVRSVWHFGYPQPENRYDKGITYSRESDYCPNCGKGLHQIAPFRMKKPPKWGKKHFLSMNWVINELFVSAEGKEALSQSGLSGFSFNEVRNPAGTQALPDVWQLNVKERLRSGINPSCQAVAKVYTCSKCNSPKLGGSGEGMLEINGSVFENAPDIVKTGEDFGTDGIYCMPATLINHRFYDFLTKNQMDKNLEFHPVKLI